MHRNYKFGIFILLVTSTIQVVFLLILKIHPTNQIMSSLYGSIIYALICLVVPFNDSWKSIATATSIFLFSILPKTLIDFLISKMHFDQYKNTTTYCIYLILLVVIFFITRKKEIERSQYTLLYGANFIYLIVFSTSLFINSRAAEFCDTRKSENNIIIDKINTSITENKSIYVILSDGYPSPKSLLTNVGMCDSFYSAHLQKKGFYEYENTNNPTSTPISISQKFFDAKWKNSSYEFAYFDANYLNNNIIPKSTLHNQMQLNKYKFSFNSFLNQKAYFNSNFFSNLWFSAGYTKTFMAEICDLIPYLYRRYQLHLHLPIDELQENIKDVIAHKFNRREVAFFHLMTFHHSKPFDYNGSDTAFFKEQMVIAQKSIVQTIDRIEKYQPTSTIILVSDHGERNLFNNKSSGDGILYMKN